MSSATSGGNGKEKNGVGGSRSWVANFCLLPGWTKVCKQEFLRTGTVFWHRANVYPKYSPTTSCFLLQNLDFFAVC